MGQVNVTGVDGIGVYVAEGLAILAGRMATRFEGEMTLEVGRVLHEGLACYVDVAWPGRPVERWYLYQRPDGRVAVQAEDPEAGELVLTPMPLAPDWRQVARRQDEEEVA